MLKRPTSAFSQEKALVGAFSVITNLWMQLFEALVDMMSASAQVGQGGDQRSVPLQRHAPALRLYQEHVT